MSKVNILALLSMLFQLGFFAEASAETFHCKTLSLKANTPESGRAFKQLPTFVVDVKRGVSRLGAAGELSDFKGFCDRDSDRREIQCQKLTNDSGKWLFIINLAELSFLYSQGSLTGRLEIVSYSGNCSESAK